MKSLPTTTVSKPSTPVGRRRARGQGMMEYIIIVALIAVAAIGVYNLFGKTVRNQMAGIAAGLAGDNEKSTTASERAATAAGQAATRANERKSLSDFGSDSGKQ